MASIRTLSLLLLSQFMMINAQTGDGCPPQTCSDPNQILIDAIHNHQGDFVGGCYCACPPDLYESTSPSYCAAPKEVNFDATTKEGDCSCSCPGNFDPLQPATCPGPSSWNPDLCECECPEQAPNGAFYPECTAPLIRDITTCDCAESPTSAPTTPSPTAPVTVSCGITSTGSCSCPFGHGDCTVHCKGASDTCKDSDIVCRNGYDCVVNCVSLNSCSGETIIKGPAGATLTVNCIGNNACSGDTRILGQDTTELTINCKGSAACKGSGVQFHFGNGMNTVLCNGRPDSCTAVEYWKLPNNAHTLPGVGFECIGFYCPATAPEPFFNSKSPTAQPTAAPSNNPTNNPTLTPTGPPTTQPTLPSLAPTDNPLNNLPRPQPPNIIAPVPAPIRPTLPNNGGTTPGGLENKMCTRTGSCFCPQGNGDCMIHCEGTTDACKDGIIQCNRNGFDCIVNCISENSCSGGTSINGPVGGSLTVNCIGQKSCGGNVNFNAQFGNDLTVHCEGSEACKGNAVFNFGVGRGMIACTGYPDSCQGSVFRNRLNAMSVQCTGHHCPFY